MAHHIVYLHGFTQTHHHWHACADAVARRLTGSSITLLDLPGHGLSAGDRAAPGAAAPHITALGGRGTYVGYSMGGRFALAAATRRPVEIERLVLIGATAGLSDATERSARVADDESRAARIEQIGVPDFVAEWLAAPMFAGLAPDGRDRSHRLANTTSGLAASLRLAGTGVQTPIWQLLPTITIPVLVLAGERDAKFTEIGHRLTAALPNATFAAIPGAGHAAHAEQPAVTAELIAGWISRAPTPT
jgi:2-succinyl-6-hydroxy-2,4-cyclohexadiene-1-carboxylate synthase